MAGETNRFIGIEHFGKDHWSLLAYVECRCVDNDGIIDHQHLRINPDRHLPINRPRNPNNWKPGYGTRLRGYFVTTLFGVGITNPVHQVKWHDDWDCLEDLEGAGWCKCPIPSPSPEPVAPTGEPKMDDWSRMHTKVCPHCGKCYHENPNRSKHRVAQAPEDLQKFGIKAIHEDLVEKG